MRLTLILVISLVLNVWWGLVLAALMPVNGLGMLLLVIGSLILSTQVAPKLAAIIDGE